jgi:hypothetical protein
VCECMRAFSIQVVAAVACLLCLPVGPARSARLRDSSNDDSAVLFSAHFLCVVATRVSKPLNPKP